VHEKRAMLDWWGPVLYEYYSSTEGGGTTVRPGEWLEHPGTVGRAWDGAEIAILDEAGRELPPGETGLVYIRNNEPFVYHNAPEKTARARREDLFTVGDLGFVDEDGWLFLTDRRADLIISGGVNIYPAEVEEVLLAHPAVADVAVVGLPDDDLGTKVHAVVEAVPEAVPGAALGREIRRFCEQRMARFKRPRTISFRRVPRSATGKVNHSALRRKLLGGQKGDERHVRDSA
jgi:long-chain acyl-CoA synthetase